MKSFVYPEPALCNDKDGKVLTPKQIKQWKTNGYCLVNDVIPTKLMQRVIREAVRMTKVLDIADFGSGGLLEFPTDSKILDSMSIHERLLTAVSQLLGTKNIRLRQADLWKKAGTDKTKYGDYENYDQRIHMDYPNHTLVHPPRWNDNNAVEIIIYMSDCNECGGSTAVVPKQNDNDFAYKWPYTNMPGVGALKWMNNKKSVERCIEQENFEMYELRQELYKREKYVYFIPGTFLFYRYDLWHRGTLLKPGKLRYTQNMAFTTDKGLSWVGNWNRAPTYSMYRKDQSVEKLIANCTVFQRNVLGFPKPGDKYWNKYTIEAVRKRYEPLGMDISPYLIKSKL